MCKCFRNFYLSHMVYITEKSNDFFFFTYSLVRKLGLVMNTAPSERREGLKGPTEAILWL